jgi:hypothetical protein
MAASMDGQTVDQNPLAVTVQGCGGRFMVSPVRSVVCLIGLWAGLRAEYIGARATPYFKRGAVVLDRRHIIVCNHKPSHCTTGREGQCGSNCRQIITGGAWVPCVWCGGQSSCGDKRRTSRRGRTAPRTALAYRSQVQVTPINVRLISFRTENTFSVAVQVHAGLSASTCRTVSR